MTQNFVDNRLMRLVQAVGVGQSIAGNKDPSNCLKKVKMGDDINPTLPKIAKLSTDL